jgi:Xaa-Pro aminopeptidase
MQRVSKWGALIAFLMFCAAVSRSSEFAGAEFEARRERAIKLFPDGILLLHANSAVSLDAHGFQQNPAFYYFTGLGDAVSAILAIDGVKGDTWLFIPGEQGPLWPPKRALLKPGPATAAQLKVDHVVSWNDFAPFIDRRLAESVAPIIYWCEEPWMSAPNLPAGVTRDDDAQFFWRYAIAHRWPNATMRSAVEMLDTERIKKSAYEIATLRRTAKVSARALLAGMRGVHPGRSQREVEAEIVHECIRAGGEGPSFWPWVMSGPNDPFPAPMDSFADYHHLNRAMKAGELVRVDVGCDLDHYQGDVGRTVPVSGHFDPGQREIWDIFVAAYHAGLRTLHDGVRKTEVYAAWRQEVERHRSNVKTAVGKMGIETMLSKNGTPFWQIHAVGLDATNAPQVLRAGMTIAFEPMVTVDGVGYYLEDMILITMNGHEVLTDGLPYNADDLERSLR